jgi:O-antigen ligase
MNLFNKLFKTAFLFIFLAELLSLCGYLLPAFNEIAFFVIVGLALVLTLQKLEYGIYIVLAELFIGSKGYLFFFEHSGFVISIRIALWLIVMAVWAGKVVVDLLKNHGVETRQWRVSTLRYFFVLFIFIVWGAVNGILKNEFSNVFFDFNNWLYFLLIFPVFHVVGTQDFAFLRGVMQVFTAAIIWLCVKTFFLLFIFSHNLIGMVYEIYRWTRVSGVGEITLIQSGFYRIFFQSHIFVLIGFFVFLVLFINKMNYNFNFKSILLLPLSAIFSYAGNFSDISSIKSKNKFKETNYLTTKLAPKLKSPENKKILILLFCFIAFLFSCILITFSRSFWVGFLFGLLAVYAYLIWQKTSPPSLNRSYGEARWKKILQVSGILAGCGILSLVLIFAIVKFPYPSPTAGFSVSLLSDRASDISEGAAVSSRWNLLPELWNEIKSAPILGKGFGATVTYISSDPRVLETSPTGEYTTYAFEWDWLDIWLKMGVLGLLAYLVLIGKIILDGFKLMNGDESKIILGLTIGLAVVAVVSIFSPYMNHPLGIGYLILVSAMLEGLKVKK